MTDTSPLAGRVRAFLARPGQFATLATVDPDGAPRQAVIWYRLEPDGPLTINSADGRLWPANLRRDSRCGLVVADPADPYVFVALTGTAVEVIDDQAVAQADIADLARRYHPDEPSIVAKDVARFRSQHRVTFRIVVAGIHDHLDG